MAIWFGMFPIARPWPRDLMPWSANANGKASGLFSSAIRKISTGSTTVWPPLGNQPMRDAVDKFLASRLDGQEMQTIKARLAR